MNLIQIKQYNTDIQKQKTKKLKKSKIEPQMLMF